MMVYFEKSCDHLAAGVQETLAEAGYDSSKVKRDNAYGSIKRWTTSPVKIDLFVPYEQRHHIRDALVARGYDAEITPMGNIIVLGRPCILHRSRP